MKGMQLEVFVPGQGNTKSLFITQFPQIQQNFCTFHWGRIEQL